jgi:TrkA domain protein
VKDARLDVETLETRVFFFHSFILPQLSFVVRGASVRQTVVMEIFETSLPGIGVRYEFDTSRGRRIGVLVHRDGRRELLIYCKGDEDSCSEAIDLDTGESAALVELFGGTRITERLSDLRHEVQGLAIEWVDVSTTSPLVNRTIGDGKIRTQTNASVVAVIRGDESIPGPGPDFQFQVGDVALVTGSHEGVAMAARLIAG